MDDVISTELAFWLMPFAAILGGDTFPGGAGGFTFLNIILALVNVWLATVMFSILGLIFIAFVSTLISLWVCCALARRIPLAYHHWREYAVPSSETRGPPRIGPQADELLAH